MKPGFFSSVASGLCCLTALAFICAGGFADAATPDASPETAQRLAALEKGFQDAADREAGTTYLTAIETMDKGYAGAVERALAAAMQAGKTDDALALRDEKKRIEKGDPMPTDETGNEPETLTVLRKTYRSSREPVEATRLKKLQPLFDKYLQALAAVSAELTKAGKLDDALQVKVVAEEVAKARASGNTGAAVVSTSGKRKLTGLERSFTNSLGMKFVPVPGTKVMFCIHETRRKDYAIFAAANSTAGDDWRKPMREGVPVGSGSEDDPVASLGWDDAVAFCAWLSKEEGHTYRLPTDREWSVAVGIASREDPNATPLRLSGKIKDEYPWGKKWPPPRGSGNFQDEAYKHLFHSAKPIVGYNDGFATTAPVMSFRPNQFGLYDMAGNVWEMCADWNDETHKLRVSRGSSWSGMNLNSSLRNGQDPKLHSSDMGFRCVVEPDK